MNKHLIATLIVVTLSPCGAYAGAADSVGDGISDVVGGVGNAVTDVGKGVGDGVSDIGNGIGDAFSSGNHNKSTVASDAEITADVNTIISDLKNTNKIAVANKIRVKTVNGVVYISGVVVNARNINTIKSAIMRINGVKAVNTNGLNVK